MYMELNAYTLFIAKIKRVKPNLVIREQVAIVY